MNGLIGITRIICKKCKTVLREGIAGSRTETKICTKCMMRQFPTADPNSIKKPPGIQDVLDNLKSKHEIIKEKAQSSLEMNLPVEIDSSIVIQDGKFLFCLNFLIGGLKKFDIAFSKEQLTEFIEDLERAKLEENSVI